MKKFSAVLFGRNHAHKRAVLASFVELHHSIDKGEERVVLSHTHILTGVVDSAALADDNVAGDAFLTAKNLNT